VKSSNKLFLTSILAAASLGAISLAQAQANLYAAPNGQMPSWGSASLNPPGGAQYTSTQMEQPNMNSLLTSDYPGTHDGSTTGGGDAPDYPLMPYQVGIQKVSVGRYASAALDVNGNVWTWGYNAYSRLGAGMPRSPMTPSSTPKNSVTAAGWNTLMYSGGLMRIAFVSPRVVTATSGLKTPPSNYPSYSDSQFNNSARIVDISAGSYFFVALDDHGRVWGWGRNARGEAGQPLATTTSGCPNDTVGTGGATSVDGGCSFPQIVQGLPACPTTPIGGATSYTDNGYDPFYSPFDPATANSSLDDACIIAVRGNVGELGYPHAMALTKGGDVWAWGDNQLGELGQGSTSAFNATPSKVKFPAGTKIVDVQPGDYHDIALDDQGQVWTWGQCGLNIVGNGLNWATANCTGYYTTPQLVNDTSLTRTSDVIPDGQLTTPNNNSTPRKGGTITLPVLKISNCFDHSLILDSNHVVWEWGFVFQGGGLGDQTTIYRPQKVEWPDKEVTRVGYTPVPQDIAAGESVAYFIDQYGRAWAWGSDIYYGFGREGGYNNSLAIVTTQAYQYPQVIGDGDSQEYDNSPKNPYHDIPSRPMSFSALTSVAGPTGFNAGGYVGDLPPGYPSGYAVSNGNLNPTPLNSANLDPIGRALSSPASPSYGIRGLYPQHPTIYDGKYADAAWISIALTSEVQQQLAYWKAMAFMPMPRIKHLTAGRSGYNIIDYNNNIYRWSYDGSGQTAWGNGDFYNQIYDNTGNGNYGVYDKYNYEVMLMPSFGGTQHNDQYCRSAQPSLYCKPANQGPH